MGERGLTGKGTRGGLLSGVLVTVWRRRGSALKTPCKYRAAFVPVPLTPRRPCERITPTEWPAIGKSHATRRRH